MGNTNGMGENSAMGISSEAPSAFTSEPSTYTSAFAIPLGTASAPYSITSPPAAAVGSASIAGGSLTTTDSPGSGAPKSILKNKVRFAPDPQRDEGGNTEITLQNTNLNRGRKAALDLTTGSSSAAILGTKRIFQTMSLIIYKYILLF